MKATSANLLSIIKGPKQFVIPIYQRTYSWNIPQCEQLFKDILRINNHESMQGHFIGSVVYFQESIHTVSDVPKLLLIDGQQRLTTVTLIITALAEFIRDNDIEIDTTFTKLQNYYLINPEEDSDLRYKLLLTKSDKETLANIIKGIKPTDLYDSLMTSVKVNPQLIYEFIKDESFYKLNSYFQIGLYLGIIKKSSFEYIFKDVAYKKTELFNKLRAMAKSDTESIVLQGWIEKFKDKLKQ